MFLLGCHFPGPLAGERAVYVELLLLLFCLLEFIGISGLLASLVPLRIQAAERRKNPGNTLPCCSSDCKVEAGLPVQLSVTF